MYSIIFDMSKWVVSQRPFTRKRRKQSIKKILNRSWISVPDITINEKFKNLLSRWVCFIMLIVCSVLFLIKSLFFQSKHTISQVAFSDATLATYQDVDLFNFISNEVKGQNYFVITSNKDTLLSKIQNWFTVRQLGWLTTTQSFPFVWDIKFYLDEEIHEENPVLDNELITVSIRFPDDLPIDVSEKNTTNFPLRYANKLWDKRWGTLWVQLLYYEPKVLVKLGEKKYAVRDEDTYIELKEWMTLSLTKLDQNCDESKEDCMLTEIFTIETPMYLTGTTSLNWLFFELSLSNLLTIIPLAKENFPNMKRFVYLAWSTRILIVTPDDKSLYFNFPEWVDITEQWNMQINKYNLLKEKFSNFNEQRAIDLWALEENKVIISNKDYYDIL